MRRSITRFLRIRNLLMFTLIVVMFYLLKSLSQIELNESENGKSMDHDTDIFLPLQKVLTDFGEIKYFVPETLRVKDWHNYTQIDLEKKRVGIGEQGRPASLPESEAKLVEELYSVNGFNGALSDKIPLNRSIADIRHRGCSAKFYLSSLPTVSVVVPFHNEHWSTLLRTAHSVLMRAPAHLIKEVLLVDDASTKEFLKGKLDAYLSAHLPRVRVVRLPRRSGLITARLAGAKQASGDVLLFLDSHTEANVNFLPPLLDPIARDYRVVVCPFIDVVAYDTFEYRAQDEGARGAFDWEFFYKRLPVLPKDQANMPEPFESPVMAGGLFAISRAFFWELGGYDPGLDIWGGEQYELSFKIWQCGGRMLDAPCSRVGHIYRKFAPFPNPNRGDFVGKNYRRVAEVWMDEYKEHLYNRRPHYRSIDTGDISEQKALRRRLRCKSFKWFITQIAFDLTLKYPPVEPKPFAEGRIRPLDDPGLCIDSHHGNDKDSLTLTKCSDSSEHEFTFSWHKDIKTKSRKMCWDLPEAAPRSKILLFSCHLGGGNQLWKYDMDTHELRQGKDANCVEYDPTTLELYINRCTGGARQKWQVDSVDRDLMAGWDQTRDVLYSPAEVVQD